MFRAFRKNLKWHDIEKMSYKKDSHSKFQNVTRQVLFSNNNQSSELRYFEIELSGYTALEKHKHVHSVIVLRGSGLCLVGSKVRHINKYDLITAPSQNWHQFRANNKEPLGFFCVWLIKIVIRGNYQQN